MKPGDLCIFDRSVVQGRAGKCFLVLQRIEGRVFTTAREIDRVLILVDGTEEEHPLLWTKQNSRVISEAG